MLRSDIINYLIKKYNLNMYLEIGIGDGSNFNLIECDDKSSVDPFFDSLNGQNELNPPTYRMTSNEYFEKHNKKYDLIFVDGLHTSEQTLLDIQNSLKCINENGFVLAHDTLPLNEYDTRLEYNGTCWKAIAFLRCNSDNLIIQTINTDHGVSIIKFGKSEKYNFKYDDIDFNYYHNNKKQLLNIIDKNLELI